MREGSSVNLVSYFYGCIASSIFSVYSSYLHLPSPLPPPPSLPQPKHDRQASDRNIQEKTPFQRTICASTRFSALTTTLFRRITTKAQLPNFHTISNHTHRCKQDFQQCPATLSIVEKTWRLFPFKEDSIPICLIIA